MKKAANKLSVLLTTYQELRTRQEFFRAQQWRIIYYSVALYAVIYFIFDNIQNIHLLVILGIAGLIICGVCIWLLITLNSSLRDSRYNLGLIESVVPIIKATTCNRPRQELLDYLKSETVICTCSKTGDRNVELSELTQNETRITWLLIVTNSISYLVLILVLIFKYSDP